jgi:hypothetical protein
MKTDDFAGEIRHFGNGVEFRSGAQPGTHAAKGMMK